MLKTTAEACVLISAVWWAKLTKTQFRNERETAEPAAAKQSK